VSGRASFLELGLQSRRDERFIPLTLTSQCAEPTTSPNSKTTSPPYGGSMPRSAAARGPPRIMDPRSRVCAVPTRPLWGGRRDPSCIFRCVRGIRGLCVVFFARADQTKGSWLRTWTGARCWTGCWTRSRSGSAQHPCASRVGAGASCSCDASRAWARPVGAIGRRSGSPQGQNESEIDRDMDLDMHMGTSSRRDGCRYRCRRLKIALENTHPGDSRQRRLRHSPHPVAVSTHPGDLHPSLLRRRKGKRSLGPGPRRRI
jgi:hypothetical protein